MNPLLLRYYEIRFTVLISNYFKGRNMKELMAFLELSCTMSGADMGQISQAALAVLSQERSLKIIKWEYVVVLRHAVNFSYSQIREMVKLNNAAISAILKRYNNKEFNIEPAFDIIRSTEVTKFMQFYIDVLTVYM